MVLYVLRNLALVLLYRIHVVPIIPPKKNRKQLREYDKHLYKLRQLVENAFFFLKAGVGLPRAIPKILPRLLLLSKFVVLLFDSLVIDDTVVAAVVDCNPSE